MGLAELQGRWLTRWGPRFHVANAAVLSLALLAGLIWWLAGQVWPLLAPVAVAPLVGNTAVADELGRQITRRPLFGQPASSAPAAATVVAPAGASLQGLRLVGLLASSRASASAALIAQDNQPPRLIREGQEISPGIVLKRVRAQYVIISLGGSNHELRLPEKTPPRSPATR